MKGYYLFAPVEPGNIGQGSGVERKVRAQQKALNQYVDCKLVILPLVKYTGGIMEKVFRRLPYTAAWRKWEYRGEFDDADFIYIRQVYHDQSFLRYLKQIRKHNPSVKLIYEVPTYPFESEEKTNWSNYPYYLKRKRSVQKIFDQMDRIVTFYGQKSIYSIPCIDLINGFDFSSVELSHRELCDEINVISVAMTASWHGYDRFLAGLVDYYEHGGEENIIYHYVGNVMPEHRRFVDEHGISAHVLFHGLQAGEQLKNLMMQSVIGIDVLGGHRKDYPVSSSLKSREYCAYGIPVITSSPIDFMPEDSPYQCLMPYDDSPVDMEKVIQFYHSLYDDGDINSLSQEIRAFAEERCDMRITMKPVADWLLSSER